MDKENSVIEGLSCVILVGGESRRIGSDKAQVKFRGKKLFRHVFEKISPLFDDIMISAHDRDYPADTLGDIREARLVYDNKADKDVRGPALGLTSALSEARNQWVFMTACDQPLIRPELIKYLAGLRADFDCIVPVTDGKVQSLFACFKKSCLPALRERIENAETKKGRSLYGFLKEDQGIRVRYVTELEVAKIDPELQSFIDIDTLEELAELEENH